MKSNSALLYLSKTKIKNSLKRILRKPLKTLGILLFVAYLFIGNGYFLSFVKDLGLNNPTGFVAIVTLGNLWITLPSLLTYLKRKGVAFDKSDVNFLFATPLKSKDILVYSLYKQTYISVLFSVFMAVCGLFLFHISLPRIFVFFLFDIIIYGTLLNLVGVIMYGSYAISPRLKKVIKYMTFIIMATVLVMMIGVLIKGGTLSFDGILSLLTHPLIYVVPIVGQSLGVMNLIILGPNLFSIIALIALFIEIVIAFKFVAMIPNDGEYYEDALSFAEDIQRLQEKADSEGIFSIKKRKKKSINNTSQIFKSRGPKVIFERQLLEYRRSTRFILSFRDIFLCIVSCVLGIFIIRLEISISTMEYFLGGIGTILYITLFYSKKPLWHGEFTNLMYYTIPQKGTVKLIYANLLDYIIALLRNIVVITPLSIATRQKPTDVVVLILLGLLIEIMISASKMVSEHYIAIKINEIFAGIVSMLISALIMIPVVVLLTLISVTQVVIPFLIVAIAYCSFVSFVFLYWASKLFDNLETVKS